MTEQPRDRARSGVPSVLPQSAIKIETPPGLNPAAEKAFLRQWMVSGRFLASFRVGMITAGCMTKFSIPRL